MLEKIRCIFAWAGMSMFFWRGAFYVVDSRGAEETNRVFFADGTVLAAESWWQDGVFGPVGLHVLSTSEEGMRTELKKIMAQSLDAADFLDYVTKLTAKSPPLAMLFDDQKCELFETIVASPESSDEQVDDFLDQILLEKPKNALLARVLMAYQNKRLPAYNAWVRNLAINAHGIMPKEDFDAIFPPELRPSIN